MSEIKQICGKELTRVFKDRKMLFSVFILPVLVMVGIMSLASNLANSAQEDVEEHTPVVYVQNEPEGFGEFFESTDGKFDVFAMKDRNQTEDMIRDGEADLLIEFPVDFEAAIAGYQKGYVTPQIKVYYNPSEDYSQAAYSKISGGVLEAYRQMLLAERVESLEELTVFTVNSDNPDMWIQDDVKAGGKAMGTLLPYFVTILLFAGAMGIGTDMIAGEKERGTMASLLVSPIRRSSIVLGKVFALMIISGVSSIIYVGAMVIFMPQMLGENDLGFSLTLSPQQVAMLAVLLVAIAFLYSAMIVLVSVFAKTVKEANSYIMPAYMLVLVLGMMTMFTTKAPAEWMYAIPVYNTSMTLQGILTQEVTAVQYGLTLGVTLVCGGVLIGVIAKAFASEKLMAI